MNFGGPYAPRGIHHFRNFQGNFNFVQMPISTRNALFVDIVHFFQSEVHYQNFIEHEKIVLDMISSHLTIAFDVPTNKKSSIKLQDLCSYYVGKCKDVPNEKIWDADICKDRGNCFMIKGRFEEALSLYSQAIRSFPWNFNLFCNRSLAYLLLNKNERSITDTEKALQLNPTCGRAYAISATAHANLGYWPQAWAAFNKAIFFEPENEAYKEKYKHFSKQFYNQSTIMLFGPSNQPAKPSNTNAMTDKELPLFTALQYRYNKLPKRDITLGNYYVEKALGLLKTNKNEEAIRSSMQALLWNSSCIPAYYIQGFSYLNLKNDEDSFTAFTQAENLEIQNSNFQEPRIDMNEKIDQFVDLADLTREHIILPVKFYSNSRTQRTRFSPFTSLYGMGFMNIFEKNPDIRNDVLHAKRLLVIDILKFLKTEFRMRGLSEMKQNYLSMVITSIETLYSLNDEDCNRAEVIQLDAFYMDRSREFGALTDAQLCEAEIFRSMARHSMLEDLHTLAIYYFTKAIDINIWNADYFGSRAYAYLQTNQLQLCINDCDSALRLDPNFLQANEISWWAHARLATCIVQPSMAYENFKAIYPYKPTPPSQPVYVYVPRAEANAFSDFAPDYPLTPEQEKQKALCLKREELKFPPENIELSKQTIANSDYNVNHALSALKANKNFVAVYHCNEAIKWNPFHTAAFFIIGLSYINLNKIEDATRAFYKIEVLEFRRWPFEPVNIYAKTRIFLQIAGLTNYRIVNLLKFFSCTDIEFELENTQLTRTSEEYTVLGHKDMKCGDYYGAVLWYTKAIQAKKLIPELRAFRARAYNMVYKYRAAYKDCVTALKYNNRCAAAHDAMGLISICCGEWMQACRCFTLARKCNGDNKIFEENFEEAEMRLKHCFAFLDDESERLQDEQPIRWGLDNDLEDEDDEEVDEEAARQERLFFAEDRRKDVEAWINKLNVSARPLPDNGKQAAMLCTDPCKAGSYHMFY